MRKLIVQILSFNRPSYLKSTLSSLVNIREDTDICVLEQSESKFKSECLSIAKSFSVRVESIEKNLGQRGAINFLFNKRIYDDYQYIMLSDHDNIFHRPLDDYIKILETMPEIFIVTGYNSPEHDIQDVVNYEGENILLKESARAGHLTFRQGDFLSLLPCDEDEGESCWWFMRFDWWLTHNAPNSPKKRGMTNFIGCLPGGVEHIGRDSTWQGHYDDEYNDEDNAFFSTRSKQEILNKYPNRNLG